MVPECDGIVVECGHRLVHRMFERFIFIDLALTDIIAKRCPLNRVPVIEQECVRFPSGCTMFLDECRDFRQSNRVIDLVLEVVVVRDVRM